MIQRYDINIDSTDGEMVKTDNGDYVLKSDHLDVIAEKDEEIARLKKDLVEAVSINSEHYNEHAKQLYIKLTAAIEEKDQKIRQLRKGLDEIMDIVGEQEDEIERLKHELERTGEVDFSTPEERAKEDGDGSL